MKSQKFNTTSSSSKNKLIDQYFFFKGNDSIELFELSTLGRYKGRYHEKKIL